MERIRNAAAHNLSDLAIAIPQALQISFNFLVALVQYRLTAQFRHMSNGYLTKLAFYLWRHRVSAPPTVSGAPTLFDDRLLFWRLR